MAGANFPWNLDRPTAGHLVFTGFRGAGKSSVGRIVAARLGFEFRDSDDWIVQQSGRSVADWFAHAGELAFREREAQAIDELIRCSPGVLSVGGGAVERIDNRDRLRNAGLVVWLDADADVLWQRIQHDPLSSTQRPPLTAAGGISEVRDLLNRRRSAYQSLANITINTSNLTQLQVADQVLDLLPI